MNLTAFLGLNNVEPPERLQPGELVEATNVDVTNTGQLRRRAGLVVTSAGDYGNVFEGLAQALATKGFDLIALPNETVLHAGLGATPRLWFCDLPDGRIIYSNGTVQGIASAQAVTSFGVPIPASLGDFVPFAGDLREGNYRWQLTHVRTADGVEGAPTYSAPVLVNTGGFSLMNVPQIDGHTTNVYLTTADGEAPYLAGNTDGSMFAFGGANELLIKPCYSDNLSPPPAGILHAFWRGRVLLASGRNLHASKPHQWELFDLEKDVRQFTADITLVQPVEGGIWVGTEHQLAFLEGTQFDQLQYKHVITGRVVLGSGVRVDGDQLKRGDGRANGHAMVCIADGMLVAGYGDGGAQRITEGRYTTLADEVRATFRKERGVPQYLASVLEAAPPPPAPPTGPFALPWIDSFNGEQLLSDHTSDTHQAYTASADATAALGGSPPSTIMLSGGRAAATVLDPVDGLYRGVALIDAPIPIDGVRVSFEFLVEMQSPATAFTLQLRWPLGDPFTYFQFNVHEDGELSCLQLSSLGGSTWPASDASYTPGIHTAAVEILGGVMQLLLDGVVTPEGTTATLPMPEGLTEGQGALSIAAKTFARFAMSKLTIEPITHLTAGVS